MSFVPVRNGLGLVVNVGTFTFPDGSLGVAHVFVDSTGSAYGPNHPIPIMPAIEPVTFTDRSGVIASVAPNAQPALALPADPTRKAGSIRAGAGNTGQIIVTITNANGSHVESLGPGESYALSFGGYVIQDAVTVTGTVVNDTFSGVTFA